MFQSPDPRTGARPALDPGNGERLAHLRGPDLDDLIAVEPLEETEHGVEPAAAGQPQSQVKPSVQKELRTAVQKEQPQPSAQLQPAAVSADKPAAEAPAEAASLKEEIEDAKKSGIQEKRAGGRRSTDAPDIEKQFIRVNIERLDNLMNLVGEMVVNRNRLARQVDLIKSIREELAFSQSRLIHEIKKFEEKYEYTLTYGTPLQQTVEQPHDFFELEFDRYDDFNLLSRKLTEITNDTNEIMTELAGFFDSFEIDTSRISTITTNLQDEITMRICQELPVTITGSSQYRTRKTDNLQAYLKNLEALHLVERRVPATVPRDQRQTSRNSRYHLADPYLRFYFGSLIKLKITRRKPFLQA